MALFFYHHLDCLPRCLCVCTAPLLLYLTLIRSLSSGIVHVDELIIPRSSAFNSLKMLTLKALLVIKYIFYPLEVVTRYRDPQLQVDKNYLYNKYNFNQHLYKSSQIRKAVLIQIF